MTLTIESALAILTSLAALVGVYVNLNEKIVRQEEKIKNLTDKSKEITTWIESVSTRFEEYQKDVTKALNENAKSIERLTQILKNIEDRIR